MEGEWKDFIEGATDATQALLTPHQFLVEPPLVFPIGSRRRLLVCECYHNNISSPPPVAGLHCSSSLLLRFHTLFSFHSSSSCLHLGSMWSAYCHSRRSKIPSSQIFLRQGVTCGCHFWFTSTGRGTNDALSITQPDDPTQCYCHRGCCSRSCQHRTPPPWPVPGRSSILCQLVPRTPCLCLRRSDLAGRVAHGV